MMTRALGQILAPGSSAVMQDLISLGVLIGAVVSALAALWRWFAAPRIAAMIDAAVSKLHGDPEAVERATAVALERALTRHVQPLEERQARMEETLETLRPNGGASLFDLMHSIESQLAKLTDPKEHT